MRFETSASIFATLIARLTEAAPAPHVMQLTFDVPTRIGRIIVGDALGTVMVAQDFAAVVQRPGQATIALEHAASLGAIPTDGAAVFVTRHGDTLFVETDTGFSVRFPCRPTAVALPKIAETGPETPAPDRWWQQALAFTNLTVQNECSDRVELTVTPEAVGLAVTDGYAAGQYGPTVPAHHPDLAVLPRQSLAFAAALTSPATTVRLTPQWLLVQGDSSVTLYAKRLEHSREAEPVCQLLLEPSFPKSTSAAWTVDRRRLVNALRRATMTAGQADSPTVRCCVTETALKIEYQAPDGGVITSETLTILAHHKLPERLAFSAPLLVWRRAVEALPDTTIQCRATLTQQTPRLLHMAAPTASSALTALPLSAVDA